jgi:8-oxo-dGTP pyrophosphatase MutT (NUDIX family)
VAREVYEETGVRLPIGPLAGCTVFVERDGVATKQHVA